MASFKQFGEKKDNINAILSFIRKNGSSTRMELCNALSLSWACISDLVALLLKEDVLKEEVPDVTASSISKGRTPTRLIINGEKYVLGVDINDSGIAITVLSMNGDHISSKKWGTELFADENELAESVCDKIESMLGEKKNCCGIGVAMEGVRTDEGWRYPMTTGVVAVIPEEFIKRRFGLQVSVKHDPECVLYSVAGHCRDSLVVRVDTWIGVAAMKSGKILKLPLELGWIRYGDLKLQSILRSCARTEDYREIAEALGRSIGNLAMLLGINNCFIAGGITNWLGNVSEIFDNAFKAVTPCAEYKICFISDASDGAASLAMAEYSPTNHINKKETTV